MTPNTISDWMDRASVEAYAATVTLMEFASSFYDGCSDRKQGTISSNIINDCIACFQHLASIDGHMHLDDFASALIVWFGLLWRGKIIKKYYLKVERHLPSGK